MAKPAFTNLVLFEIVRILYHRASTRFGRADFVEGMEADDDALLPQMKTNLESTDRLRIRLSTCTCVPLQSPVLVSRFVIKITWHPALTVSWSTPLKLRLIIFKFRSHLSWSHS